MSVLGLATGYMRIAVGRLLQRSRISTADVPGGRIVTVGAAF